MITNSSQNNFTIKQQQGRDIFCCQAELAPARVSSAVKFSEKRLFEKKLAIQAKFLALSDFFAENQSSLHLQKTEQKTELAEAVFQAPFWPNVVVGSVSHTYLEHSQQILAVAAVEARSNFAAFGIDVQYLRNVNSRLIERICNTEEIRQCEFFEIDPLFFFSAKESVFKAYSQLLKKWFGFHAVQLNWNPEKHGFDGEFSDRKFVENIGNSLLSQDSFFVHCGLIDGAIWTLVRVPI